MVKHHHGVTRYEALRVSAFEFQRQGLLEAEPRIGDPFAHLEIIFERHGGDCVRIGLGRCEKLCEYVRPCRVARHGGAEFEAVLEAAIHYLTEKRDDGGPGVADERGHSTSAPPVR